MLIYLTEYFTEEINAENKILLYKENDIKLKKVIFIFQKQKSQKKTLKKELKSKRIQDFKKSIGNMKTIITNIEKEILKSRIEISDLIKEKDNLINLSFDILKQNFIDYCYNNILRKDAQNFKTICFQLKKVNQNFLI